MKSMNRVFLMGHLGSNPELVESKNGKYYARLRLATSRWRPDANGDRQEITDWHSIFVWGRQAETCAEHLRKGALVFVEGVLNYWQEDGGKLFKSAIQAEEVHFLNGKKAQHLDNPEAPLNHNAVAHPA